MVIYGILSQNGDIQKVFIDGLGNIVDELPDDDVVALCEVLERISNDYSVDFALIYSKPEASVPEAVKKYLI